jgi:hypothetical protein
LIGDLHLPPGTDDPDLLEERVPVEFNVMFPGGLKEVASRFCLALWERDYQLWAHEPPPAEESSDQSVVAPRVPAGLRRVTPKLCQCVLCYAVDGSGVINDWEQSAFSGTHSDIRRPEVAWLIAAGAAGAEAAG